MHGLDFSSRLSKVCVKALYQAASNGQDEIVETMLVNNVNSDITDATTGLTLLEAAAKNGHLQVVRVLFTASAGVLNFLDRPGRPYSVTKALHYAAANGHEEIVRFFIQHGSVCDDQNLQGETALIKAAQNGHAIVAKVLLEMGADALVRAGEPYSLAPPEPNPPIFEGLNKKPAAIHHAARFGYDDVVTILSPFKNLICGTFVIDALHICAAYGHPNVVQALLLMGTEIESRDAWGMTALHHASRNGHCLVARLLLDRGCGVNLQADGGYTALHFAATRADIETIKLLEARGAKMAARMYNGETALHLAAFHADPNTTRALVECGAPLEARDWLNRRTPLDKAIFYNRLGNVLALIELGVKWIHEQDSFEGSKMDSRTRLF